MTLLVKFLMNSTVDPSMHQRPFLIEETQTVFLEIRRQKMREAHFTRPEASSASLLEIKDITHGTFVILLPVSDYAPSRRVHQVHQLTGPKWTPPSGGRQKIISLIFYFWPISVGFSFNHHFPSCWLTFELLSPFSWL